MLAAAAPIRSWRCTQALLGRPEPERERAAAVREGDAQ